MERGEMERSIDRFVVDCSHAKRWRSQAEAKCAMYKALHVSSGLTTSFTKVTKNGIQNLIMG